MSGLVIFRSPRSPRSLCPTFSILPKTSKAMLAAIGVASVDELVRQHPGRLAPESSARRARRR